jgi:hypothetical protein
MNKLGKILAIGFGFGVLAMVLSLIPNHPVRAAVPPSGTDVIVTNTPLPVREFDAADRHPFSGGCVATQTTTGGTSCNFLVPAGEEWVIQTLSVYGNSDPAYKSVLFNLYITTATGPQYHYYTIPDNGTTNIVGGSFETATITTTLRADPGSTGTCFWSTGNSNPNPAGLSGTCGIQGYYVRLP